MMEQAEENNGDEDETDEADCEAGEKLIEYAGDVLPALGNAMTPQEFSPYYAGLLPSILLRAVMNPCITIAIFTMYYVYPRNDNELSIC